MMAEKNLLSPQNRIRRLGLKQGTAYFDDTFKFFTTEKSNALAKSIDKRMFKSILRDFYEMIAEALLDGKEVALPLNMGNLVVNKRVSDGRRVHDYGEGNKQGRPVLEFNSHTDGYRFSIIWRKAFPVFGIQNGYQFKASRVLARELAKRLKDGLGYKYQSLSNRKVNKNEI